MLFLGLGSWKMQMDVDEMNKWVCKECAQPMTQHGRYNFIYYCNNILCKFYKTLVTKKS